MKYRKSIALAASVAFTATLTSGCEHAGSSSPHASNRFVAQRSARVSAPTPIAAGEPERYRATLRLTAKTIGERADALPHLEADVARRGRDRRISFRLPDGEQVVYLKRGGTRYVILPELERYAEVRSGEAGFELPRLLMPDQLVDYLKGQDGYVRDGEEELNGRAVVKYVAEGEMRTGTHVGEINAENIVYVDKLTRLPLRAELAAEAEGDANGVRGLKVVAEMRHVRTGADPDLFVVPYRMRKVESAEVSRQVNSLISVAALIAGSLHNRMSDALADTSAPAGR